ncbi:MAG: hypothetical protein NPIRA05_00800 [Nitrospirales bacterium]|nr:MAG: hypothetical protein NPIRA05_00800 [Nitrospirales bacterium]
MSKSNRRFSRNQDDYIDFPVSSTWRNHYADQGLTYHTGQPSPRSASSDFEHSYEEILHRLELREMRASMNAMQEIINEKNEEIAQLKAEMAKRSKTNYTTPGPQKQRAMAYAGMKNGAFVDDY